MGSLTVHIQDYFEEIITELIKIGFKNVDISIMEMKKIEKIL